MLLGFGYVCYVLFLIFYQKAENNGLQKKSVGQNFVILLLFFFA